MNTALETMPAGANAGAGNRQTNNQAAASARRIHYFDWLRAIAVLGVIVYHTLLPFARDTWNIANDVQSPGLLAFAYVFESFGLGVLFLIAGGSVRFALQRRSIGAFLAERARRLLVPYILGAILLVPPTSYIIMLHRGSASGSYLRFLAEFPRFVWVNSIAPAGLSPEILQYVGMHLWFLAWLFICSALAVPVYVFLASSAGRSLVDALGRHAHWRGAVLLLGVFMAVPRVILSALPQNVTGWSLEAFVWYLLVFIVGFVLFQDDRLVAAIRGDFWPALVVALLGSCMFLFPSLVWQLLPQTYGAVPFWTGVMGLAGWAWTLVIIGFGMRVGFMQRSLPPPAGEAALPAYILHFPIVIAVSALVVQWPIGLEAKVLTNALLGTGASLLVTAVVMRISVLFPLLGLHRYRLQRRPVPTG